MLKNVPIDTLHESNNNMFTPPLLGIAIPAYKRENLLGRLLGSINADCPIVVSDNGGHLSQPFKERHASVKFLVGTEVSALENWNRAACALKTEWIIMPGDDDLYYPDSFSHIVGALHANPSADIIFFGHHIIDGNDSIKSTWIPEPCQFSAPHGFERVQRGVLSRPPGIVFKRDLYQRLDGFSQEFRVTAGDNDFYQRATLIGKSIFIGEAVTGYRVWDLGSTEQTIATQEWMQEIDLWCSRVRAFAEQQAGYHYPIELQDIIYLDNLRSGIQALKERGQHAAAWRHVMNSRYPFRSSLMAQIKLLAHLLLPNLK